jgi:glutathione peroxidase
MKKATFLITFILCLSMQNSFAQQENVNMQSTDDTPKPQPKSLHDYTVKDINGADFNLSSLKGKKVLVVNTASECGYTPQYKELEELYNLYKNQNFVIIGFPSNDFGEQEKGSNKEISAFCKKNYGVTFPMMSKVTVKGNNKEKVYQFLTEEKLNGMRNFDIKWNFQKFLIDENGKIVRVLESKVSPLDPQITTWINPAAEEPKK